MKVGSGEFKAKCLRLMETLRKTGGELIVTRRGKPLVRLTPVRPEPKRPVFGWLKGSVEIKGDVIRPVQERWDAGR